MRINLHEPSFGGEEIQAAVNVMNSTYVTQGKIVREFEEQFADKVGFKHAVAVNSGSSANLLAVSSLKAIGALRDGDEVLAPALTWPTTIWPLVQHNLVPVFVDCDPHTLNMKDIVPSTDTRGVVAVPVYGNPLEVTKRKVTMYDCCEALGTPKPDCDVATYSFYFSHHITTFEGGMVCTDNEPLADMLRIQRSHGWVRDVYHPDKWADAHPEIDPRFLFVDLGYNLRMTDIAAAVGLIQLTKLDGFVERRRRNHELYVKGLENTGLTLQTMNLGAAPFSLAITVDDQLPFTQHDLRLALLEAEIETRPIIAGNMLRQPAMQKYKHRLVGSDVNATRVMKHGFSIANHQAMTDEHVAYVVGVILEFLDRFSE